MHADGTCLILEQQCIWHGAFSNINLEAQKKKFNGIRFEFETSDMSQVWMLSSTVMFDLQGLY